VRAAAIFLLSALVDVAALASVSCEAGAAQAHLLAAHHRAARARVANRGVFRAWNVDRALSAIAMIASLTLALEAADRVRADPMFGVTTTVLDLALVDVRTPRAVVIDVFEPARA
jgi:hypothetical protein